jgi:hypothetical protein
MVSPFWQNILPVQKTCSPDSSSRLFVGFCELLGIGRCQRNLPCFYRLREAKTYFFRDD